MRLATTAATRTSGSRVSKPLTTAATLSAAERTSTTSTTGRPRVFARLAAEPRSPSNSPITPSTTLQPSAGAWRAKVRRTNAAPHMRTSRLRDTRPVTSRCRLGSMKSGPHLKGCTRTPRRASAAITARVTVVLPQPEWVPAMSSPGWRITGR